MLQILPITVQLRDLEALQTVCHRRGWEFRAGQRRYRWFGRVLDDRPAPAGRGRCVHAIGVAGCAFEIGLIDKEGALYPAWDAGPEDGLGRTLGTNGALFWQLYATEVMRRTALLHALRVGRHLDQLGTLRLRVTTAAGARIAHVRLTNAAATELWLFAPWQPHTHFLAESLGVIRRDEITFLEADPTGDSPVAVQC